MAVRAPREARPDWEEGEREAVLAELRQRADEFEDAMTHAWRSEPARLLSHPFFGGITLKQGLRLATVHTRHHAAFLPASPRA